MKNARIIKFESNITSEFIYTHLLNELHEYYRIDGISELIFDFTEVNYVAIECLPYLISIGCILKSQYNSCVKVINDTCLKCNEHLYKIGFMSINNDKKIFEMKEYYGAKYKLEDKKNVPSIFYFSQDEFVINNKADSVRNQIWRKTKGLQIRLCYALNIKDRKEYEFTGSYELNEPYINPLLKMIIEIVENSILHGMEGCSLAITTKKIGKDKKLFITISDPGKGPYVDLAKNQKILDGEQLLNFNTLEVFRKLDIENRHREAIFESILFRRKDPEYGIFSVMRYCRNYNGLLKIQSDNANLVLVLAELRPELISMFQEETTIGDCYLEEFRSYFNVTIDKARRLRGMHIGIELPIKELI